MSIVSDMLDVLLRRRDVREIEEGVARVRREADALSVMVKKWERSRDERRDPSYRAS